jgi:hypothetical protein
VFSANGNPDLALEYRLLFDKNGTPYPFDHFTCCGKCISVSDSLNCACRTRYIVYSTTCTCWRQPTQLFLVSRKVRVMAEAIFYSNNHFVTPAHLYGRHKLEVLRFLRQLPRRAVKTFETSHLGHPPFVTVR